MTNKGERKILLNCEIDEKNNFSINKNTLKTVISILSVVFAFTLFFSGAALVKSNREAPANSLSSSQNSINENLNETNFF